MRRSVHDSAGNLRDKKRAIGAQAKPSDLYQTEKIEWTAAQTSNTTGGMRYNITDGMVAMSGEYGVGGWWASFETDKIKRHLQDGASVKGLAAYWRKGKKWVPKYNIEPGTILRTQ